MARILILWNQVDDDLYEHIRAEGRSTVDWDPSHVVEDVGTVAEDFELMITALRSRGHHVELVNIVDNFDALLTSLRGARCDLVMNLVEFFGADPAHEIHIAAIYELLGMPYTGSRPVALTLCQRKHIAKAVLVAAGLPTAPYFVVTGEGNDVITPRDHGLRYPLIVKPSQEDASTGIDAASVVADFAALQARVQYVLEVHKMPALVEQFIVGREIHCAVLGDGDTARALPLFEMEFVDQPDEHGVPLPRIITYRAKWDPFSRDFYGMDGRCPAIDLEPEVVSEIQRVAVAAVRALGVRDYARVDMRVDSRTGEPFILEVNPNPDLSDGSAFVQCAAAGGLDYATVLDEIIGFAVARGHAMPAVAEKASEDPILRELRTRRGHAG